MEGKINNNIHVNINGNNGNFISNLGDRLLKIHNLHSLIESVFNVMTELVAIQDLENNVLWANISAAKSVNVKPEDLIGRKCYEIWHKNKTTCKSCPVIVSIKTAKPASAKIKSSDNRYWLINAYPILNSNGKVENVIEITTEITDKILGQIYLEKADQALKKYEFIFEHSLDGIYITTPEGKYIDANPALVKILGYSSKEELLSIDINKELYVNAKDRPGPFDRNKLFQTRLKRKDGSIIDVEISSIVIFEDGSPKYYQGIVRDITERKKLENKLNFLCFRDSLTKLYNRAYFEEEVKRLNTKRQFPITFIMVDINNLKLVNDVFGHKKGDKLIKNCARLLKKYIRKEDIIARWGGDEFAIILPKTTEEIAKNIIERIENFCQNQFIDELIPMSMSFGVETKQKSIRNINFILKEAENKMYKKKFIDKRKITDSFINKFENELYKNGIKQMVNIQLVTKLAVKLGKALNLSENKINDLTMLCGLYDIGMIAVDKKIIFKKIKISNKDFEEIKRHVDASYAILKSHTLLSHIAESALHHHEWWNGSGYPQGLKGGEIPILSRIISVVDTYVSLITGSGVEKQLTKEEAIEEIRKLSAIQFDPRIVEKFVDLINWENME